jgi:MoaA/NifB/PqqE/SkfB family radical SAM enzyme
VDFAQIEITTRCNFTCGFCAGRHMPQQDLPRADFIAILSQWPALKNIEIQGEGEPLLHEDFFALIADAKTLCPAAKLSTITNGSLLNDANIAGLMLSALDHLWISLETLEPLQFQRIRGGKLSRVLRGLRALLAAKKQNGHALKIGFAVTLLHNHVQQLPAISRLYHALGMDGGISLQGLQTMPAYQRNYDATLNAALLQPRDTEQLTQLIAGDLYVKHSLLAYQRQGGFYAQMQQQAGPGCCPWLKLGMYVDVKGRVMSCCFSKNPQHALGHFLQEKAVIEHRTALSSALLNGHIPATCEGCGIASQLARQNIPALNI